MSPSDARDPSLSPSPRGPGGDWVSVRRAKKLFRYFEADDAEQSSFSKESAELNDALLPHLQLLLLKCDADNAFVSVFDRSRLYIVAETAATGAVSLKPEVTCHGSPMVGRLCTYTLEQPAGPDSPYPIFHVPDLSEDPRFNHYPFVVDPEGALLRFYAGVNLITSSNVDISIGTVAVMGRHTKQGLDQEEQKALRTAARSIMTFLDMKRDAADSLRAKRLTSCLSDFVSHTSKKEILKPIQLKDDESTDTALKLSKQSSSPEKSTSRKTYETAMFDRALNSLTEAFELDGAGEIMFINARAVSNNAHRSSLDQSIQDMELDDSRKSYLSERIIVCSDGARELLQIENRRYAQKIERMDLIGLADNHPRGKLWQFDVHGLLPSEGTESVVSSEPEADISKEPRQREEDELIEVIRAISPRTRQIFLVPLLDPAIGQWRSICLVWCTSATRLFSHVDLSILTTYTQSLMMDRSLHEVLQTNLRKADFIGSISHELRTPLHGILAATELLELQQDTTPFQKSMIQTVKSCGTTLLDTISHVLEYSKINNIERNTKSTDSKLLAGSAAPPPDNENHYKETSEQNDLAQCLEEAVDIVLKSHHYHQHANNQVGNIALIGSTSSQETNGALNDPATFPASHVFSKVGLFIDIQPGDWTFQLPSGAFKRLIMNLVGNSLKYTESGRITIEMSISSDATKHGDAAYIVLKVVDTGCGISADYLEKRLFIPFAQEDSLYPGVGLGLSICKSIVSQMGGDLQIDSTPGKGTTVKALIPARRNSDVNGSVALDRNDLSLNSKTTIITYLDPSQSDFIQLKRNDDFLQALSTSCSTWFGADLLPYSPELKADIVIVQAKTLVQLSSEQCIQLRGLDGLVVVCENVQQQLWIEKLMSQWSTQNAVSITLPCGPYKLRKAIQVCLKARNLNQMNNTELSTQPVAPVAEFSPEEHSTRITNASPGLQVNDTKTLQSPRLLLVDDNQINLRLLQSFCKKHQGVITELATDGKMAVNTMIQAAHTNSFDIIFMDISMPIMDGIDATRAIRQYERRESLTPSLIIAVTGLVNERDRDSALQAGVDIYLTKPLKLKQITDILEDWTNSHRGKSQEMPPM